MKGETFDKTPAFHDQPSAQRRRTNDHVERASRRLRFDEKARYKWRRRKSTVRFVLLRISRHSPKIKPQRQQPPPSVGGCQGPRRRGSARTV